jgi:hypothetical protein
MSNTTSEPGDGPLRPPRSTSVDPWPHEHGEHPSGISVPDGAPARHENLAHLIGDPVVIHPGARHHLRRLGWILAAAIAVSAAVVLAMVL